jgi:hypothetical protein
MSDNKLECFSKPVVCTLLHLQIRLEPTLENPLTGLHSMGELLALPTNKLEVTDMTSI